MRRLTNRIGEIRKAKDLSRPQVAARVSPPTTYQQIERLEKGTRSLTLDWIEKLADALDVDPCELILDEVPGKDYGEGPLPFTLEEQVADEVARSFGRVALGAEPEDSLVKVLSIMLRDLCDTFARHPATLRDPQQVRPVVDLLARQHATQAR